MGNRRISSDLKDCALTLWDKGWELEDITDALLVSQASLYLWQAILEEHGSLKKPPSALHGLARILTCAVLTAVHTLYTTDPDLYLDELVLWLAIHHDIAISVSALQQNLTKAGLTRKILHKIALERDEVLRQQWSDMQASDNFLADGSQFICLDETSKNEHTYARRYGRAYSGDRAELKDVFVHGDRYSLVAALTVDGYIAAHAVPGSFDSIDFLEFVQEQVVWLLFTYSPFADYPQLPQMNPYPDACSVLVLDNCRIHHNEALVELVRAAGCLILYLPAYSPDLNPIEESFSTCTPISPYNSRFLISNL